MKTISLSLLLATGFLPAGLHAAPAGPEAAAQGEQTERGRSVPGPHFDQMWKNLDADGNGSISPEEFKSLPRLKNVPEEKRVKIFSRIDKDANGQLSREEMAAMRRGGGPMKRLRELDTDKSGGISFEEFKLGEMFVKMTPEKQEAVFKRLDSDNDGQITGKDRPRRRKDAGEGAPSPPSPPQEIMRRNDTDGDGYLTFDEFAKDPEMAELGEDEQEDRFEAADKNKDLKLTLDELSTGLRPK